MNVPRITMNQEGLSISRMVAGCWRMAEWDWQPAQRLAWIESCLDRGISCFDHADIYGNYAGERIFGEALALAPHLREKMELVSKTGIALLSSARPQHRVKHYDCSRTHIVSSVEASLKNLNTTYLDVLLIHRPSPLMHPDEVAAAFYELKQSGKVRAFGVSNFTPSQFEMLNAAFPLVTNQVECSPLHTAPLFDGTFDQALALKLPPMIWSALGGGALFSEDERAKRVRGVLQRLADARGVSIETVVYAWLLRHPARLIPILGSRRETALDAAVQACAWEMDLQDWFEILEAGAGQPVP